MKRTLLSIAVLLTFAASFAAAAQDKPNFSGTWVIDLTKSDFGPLPVPESMSLVVTHKDPALKIVSKQKGEMGEVTNERNVTTDGKDSTNKLNTGMGDPQTIVSKTSWSGKTLVSTYNLDAQGTPVGVKDTWELSPDAKVLTVTRALTTPDGDLAVKMTFNKQQ